MSVKQGGGQKSRKHKVSKGVHGGGGKVRLTELEKALIVPKHLARVSAARRRRVNSGRG